jgi:uncharacterized protein (DUF1501 family)
MWTRRQVISAGGAGLLSVRLNADTLLKAYVSRATLPSSRLLVLIQLRGGCDGLNLLSPANDLEFISARHATLRVADNGPDAGYSIKYGLGTDIDWRLHRAASPLLELYQDRKLAFVDAVGLPVSTRSHFAAIEMIEHGVVTNAALEQTRTGWLGRLLQTMEHSGLFPAVSVSAAPSEAFAGWANTIAVPDIARGVSFPGGVPFEAALRRMYEYGDSRVLRAGRDAIAAMSAINASVDRDQQRRAKAQNPVGDSVYDSAGPFGQTLLTLAHLAKLDLGIVVASLELGGWDTHDNQSERFGVRVDRLARGLAAFYSDMSSRNAPPTVVVLTEFGRRLRSNLSHGTDHGRAGLMLILSDDLAGGHMYGRWPGLGFEDLEAGMDLAVTTDYRQVLCEVISGWSRQPQAESLFPFYKSSGSLGLYPPAIRHS